MIKLKLMLAVTFMAFAYTITTAQTTENRKVSGFTSIDVSEGINVTLTMGSKESVEVTAPEGYIDRVITEVSAAGELDIFIKGDNAGNKGRHVEVNIVAKEINNIESSSGSSVNTTNAIKSDELDIDVSSGAHVDIKCEADKVSVDVSSGAGAKVQGSAGFFSADASSGSNIKAGNLVAQKVVADASSGANIKVHAEKEINARVSSGGSVTYAGSPEMVDVEKSSGGRVYRN